MRHCMSQNGFASVRMGVGRLECQKGLKPGWKNVLAGRGVIS